MKKSLLTLSCVAALAAFTACSEESEEILGSSVAQKSSKVTFSVENLFDGAQTRTILYENGISAWTAGDVIGVLPYANAEGGAPAGKSQVDFLLSDGSIKSDGSCVFDGGSWALREGWSYIAYYPFDISNTSSAYNYKEIQFDYRKLPAQNGDNTIGHLAGVDYLTSRAVTVEGGNVNFEMEHVGALLPLKLVFPADVVVMNVQLKHLATSAYLRVEDGVFAPNGTSWYAEGVNMPVTNGATTNREFKANLFVAPQFLYSDVEIAVLTDKGLYTTNLPSEVNLKSGGNESVTLEFAGEPAELPTIKPGETLSLVENSGSFVVNIEESGFYRMDYSNWNGYDFVEGFEYYAGYRKVPAGSYVVPYSTWGYGGSFSISDPLPSLTVGTQEVVSDRYYAFTPTVSGYYSHNSGSIINVGGWGVYYLNANELYMYYTYGNEMTIEYLETATVSLDETVSIPSSKDMYIMFTPTTSGWFALDFDNASGYLYDGYEESAGSMHYMSAGKTKIIRAYASSEFGGTLTIKEADSPTYVSAGVKLTQPGVYVYMLPQAHRWYVRESRNVYISSMGGSNRVATGDYFFTTYSNARVDLEIKETYDDDAYFMLKEVDGPSVNVGVNELFIMEPNSTTLVAVNIPEAGTYTITNDDVRCEGGFCIYDEYGNYIEVGRNGNSATFYRSGVYYFQYFNNTEYTAYVTVKPE